MPNNEGGIRRHTGRKTALSLDPQSVDEELVTISEGPERGEESLYAVIGSASKGLLHDQVTTEQPNQMVGLEGCTP